LPVRPLAILPVSLSRMRYLSRRFRTIRGIAYPYSGRMGRPELTSVKHEQTTAHEVPLDGL
jgi:predicted amidophosphoribosyltransferase